MYMMKQGYRIVIDQSVVEYRAMRLIMQEGGDAVKAARQELVEAKLCGQERRALMSEAILDEVSRQLAATRPMGIVRRLAA